MAENVKHETEKQPRDHDRGSSDADFQDWLATELQKDPLYKEYPDIFDAAPVCIMNWRRRYRGDPALWNRVFKKERVMKEFIEAVPIIDAVQRLVINNDESKSSTSSSPQKFTIVDLASGRGYLSMLLSELLPPDKVEKFVLIDKAWPMHNTTPKPSHISWNHIYGNLADDNEDAPRYYDTWPIPLTTSKQDLKHTNQRRNVEERFFRDGPVILLAVHLCGTLSLKAVDFFNQNPNIQFFCLKPCCLPGMVHAERHEVFQLGKHSFDSKTVCMAGRWKKDKWHGPRRTQLKEKFEAWAEHLFLGMDDDDGKKIKVRVMVQHDGGHQNEFLLAERSPTTTSVWNQLGSTSQGAHDVADHDVADEKSPY
jgi:hypothetical protein